MSSDQKNGVSDAERKRLKSWEVLPSPEVGKVFSAAWRRLHPMAWRMTKGRCGLFRTRHSIVWRDQPRAYCEHHADGSTSVVVHEGLIWFTYDVINALFASARWRGEKTALQLDCANELLRRCYANWEKFFDGNQERSQLPLLSDQVGGLAAVHRAAALCFIALHEYGHATLHRGREDEQRAVLEDEADRWGFDALLKLFRHDPAREFSGVVAGGLLMPRLFSALQRFGVEFPESYPTPAERMRSLLDVLRKGLRDEISFALATSSAAALSQRMEAFEPEVDGSFLDAELVEMEFNATLTALLLEVGWHKLPATHILPIMEQQYGFSASWLQDRVTLLDHLYRTGQPTLEDQEHLYHLPAKTVVETWSNLRSTLTQ